MERKGLRFDRETHEGKAEGNPLEERIGSREEGDDEGNLDVGAKVVVVDLLEEDASVDEELKDCREKSEGVLGKRKSGGKGPECAGETTRCRRLGTRRRREFRARPYRGRRFRIRRKSAGPIYACRRSTEPHPSSS